MEQFAAEIPGLFVSKAVEQTAGMLASISESTTLIQTSEKTYRNLSTGSSQHAESLHLLSKARRLWRDKVSLKRGHYTLFDSYESWAVADALRQDPGIDTKIKLDADALRPSSAHDWTPLINARPPSLQTDWICQMTT